MSQTTVTLDSEGNKAAHDVWVQWIESDAGIGASDPTTLQPVESHRSYMQNRLHRAFGAGLDAGAKLAREQAVRRVCALLLS